MSQKLVASIFNQSQADKKIVKGNIQNAISYLENNFNANTMCGNYI